MNVLSTSRALLRTAATEHGGAVLVGLSGGKDSLATLDLCMQAFDRVEAYFMYMVEGVAIAEAPMVAAAHRYGIKVHRFPHWLLGRFIKNAVYMPHRGSTSDWPNTKMTDIELAARDASGIALLAYGHRMDESLERRGMLHSFAGYNRAQRRVYPLWNWSKRDVVAYLRGRRIPVPEMKLRGIDPTDPACMQLLREKYPDDYAKVLQVFPFAGAQFAREDYMKAREPEGAAVNGA
jgi:phosphoadenosine phosphosulfate reductase